MLDIETLRKIRIFEDLQREELKILLPYLKVQEYQKGEYILTENSSGDQFYILVKGRVKISRDLVKAFDEDMPSTQKVLATLTGESLPTFGENGLLGQAPRNANVIAGSDCLVYSLSKQDFDDFSGANISAAYQIMRKIAQILTERLKMTDDNMVKLATALYIAVQT